MSERHGPMDHVLTAAFRRVKRRREAASSPHHVRRGDTVTLSGEEFSYIAALQLQYAFLDFRHLLSLVSRAATVNELSLLLRLYAVSWITLSDLAANVINAVFDLGYAERDVDLSAILRNGHIRDTQIPSIVKRHGPQVRFAYWADLRNNIVHRGRLLDDDFLALERVWIDLALKASNDTQGTDGSTSAVGVESNFAARLEEFKRKRIADLDEHLTATNQLLWEIGEVLVGELEES